KLPYCPSTRDYWNLKCPNSSYKDYPHNPLNASRSERISKLTTGRKVCENVPSKHRMGWHFEDTMNHLEKASGDYLDEHETEDVLYVRGECIIPKEKYHISKFQIQRPENVTLYVFPSNNSEFGEIYIDTLTSFRHFESKNDERYSFVYKNCSLEMKKAETGNSQSSDGFVTKVHIFEMKDVKSLIPAQAKIHWDFSPATNTLLLEDSMVILTTRYIVSKVTSILTRYIVSKVTSILTRYIVSKVTSILTRYIVSKVTSILTRYIVSKNSILTRYIVSKVTSILTRYIVSKVTSILTRYIVSKVTSILTRYIVSKVTSILTRYIVSKVTSILTRYIVHLIVD
ncbi:hypothetical protein CEXT_805961, partial [Caerostris extrusa]